MLIRFSVLTTAFLLLTSVVHGQSPDGLTYAIYTLASGSAGSTVSGGILPDMYYSGGNIDTQPNTIDTSNASTDMYFWVYQNERYGVFTYTLPSLTVGQYYTLKLHFAETTFTSPGQRQFNVAINGTPYLNNFDIVAEAGAPNRALVKTFVVTPNASGQIVISFTAGAASVAKLSGLELWAIALPSSGVATAGATPVLQINSGSGASAGSFSADAYYSGGTASSYSATIDMSAVNNPAPLAAYQAARTGTFSYTLSGLIAGQIYTVRLHFAENQYTTALQRQFNATINGIQELTNFDIIAEAGAPNKAIVKPFSMAANSSGQIVIAFTLGSSGGVPTVSAIEVVTGFRVNSGGPGASYWEADQGFYLGGTFRTTATVDTSEAVNPAPVAVYQSCLYGGTTYTFHNLTPGFTYTVRLHFAEELYYEAGQREFNVAINGTQVLTNYDIFANAGAAYRANIQQFSTEATSSGEIVVIDSTGAVDTAYIMGIEILGGSASVAGAGQYEISGYVTLGGSGPSAGTPITGAELTISGAQSGVATTASNGSYFFIVNAGGPYTITASWPSSPHYTLTAPIIISTISSNQPNEDFNAVLQSGGTLNPSAPNKEYIFMNGAIVAVEHPH